MSEHAIADCPECGKRDYMLKEDNVWFCLKCHHSEKMPKSKFDSESEGNSGIFSVLVAIFIMINLGGKFSFTPSQDLNRQPQLHY